MKQMDFKVKKRVLTEEDGKNDKIKLELIPTHQAYEKNLKLSIDEETAEAFGIPTEKGDTLVAMESISIVTINIAIGLPIFSSPFCLFVFHFCFLFIGI